jgi:diguanylate cyclase (GGDEF)-like protein
VVGEYDLKLVALSVVVAIIASCTALELAGRVSSGRGRSAWLWLLGGAVSMGTGIWSMHFIGMLAFSLPIPMAYDFEITMLSMLIAVAVSGIALLVVKRPFLTRENITVGATLMGIGICAMHYTGMFAMRMSPPIQYDPVLFIASVIIAITASLAALWIAFRLRREYSFAGILAKLGSAVVMGIAISGMHYTGMAAAQFAPDSICLAADSTAGMDNATLAVIIGITTLSIMLVTLGISAIDAHYAAHTAKLADTLQVANERLRNVALYDNLTGLPNRFLLQDRLDQAVCRADRSAKPFALMFIDLDRFKPANDSFGHHVGDRLLQAVAQRLTSCVRKEDTVARTGGDEFVVVLSQIGNAGEVASIGEKIIEMLSQPFVISEQALEISCSIGISMYPMDAKDVATLMHHADTAMYGAKRGGRSRIRFFDAAGDPPVQPEAAQ